MSPSHSIRHGVSPGPGSRPARAARLALIAGMLLFGPGASRSAEIDLHGSLEVVAAARGRAYDLNKLTRGDSPFDAYGLRLFADAAVNDQLQVFTQVVLRDATMPYVDGAYLSFAPLATRDLNVMAGKVPWPIGTYAPRTYASKNPLIGAPLMYQYHSTLLWYEVVPNADALLATAGAGQYGVNYFGYPEGRGMPIVDDSYWDVGVMVVGSERPVEYAIGAMAGTPGWGSTSQDENSGKTLLGRIGIAPYPGIRFGLSAARGPYLIEALDASIPAGASVNDFLQELVMADLELLAGHVELRAEGALNTWETPTVGDLDVSSGYVELKYAFPIGAYVAGRWDALRFEEIADSTGAMRSWDANVDRFEVGAGYRFTRDALVKVVFQRAEIDVADPDPTIRRPSLIAAQVSVGF